MLTTTGTVTTFTVTTTVDSPLSNGTGTTCVDSETTPQCSLRAAIQAANNLGTPVQIQLASDVYSLTDSALGALTVADPGGVTLVGTGAATTTISAPPGSAYGLILVCDENSVPAVLTASNLTLSGGAASAGGAVGIVSSNASATLTGVTMTGNHGSLGGAVYDAGSLSLTNDTLSGNSAGDGGGVAVVNGVLSVSGGSVAANTATAGFGGGVYAANSTVTMASVSVTGNSVSSSKGAAAGGGLYSSGSTVTLTSTSFTSNQAEGAGGGIYASGNTTLQMTGGSVSTNAVTTVGDGGGLFLAAPSVTLTTVTVTSNSVPNGGYGGGIVDDPVVSASTSATTWLLDVTGSTISSNSNGGLFVNGAAGQAIHVEVSKSSINSNTASASYACGAGVCVNVPTSTSPFETDFTTDKIENNTESGGLDAAGGLQVESSGTGGQETLHMSGDTVTGNTTSSQGGTGGVAVDLLAGSSAIANITSSSISSNSAPDGHGGGVQLTSPTSGAASSITTTMTSDKIASNTSGSATQAAGIGGGLFVSGDVSGTITSTSFTSNHSVQGPSASGNGGGMYYTGSGTMHFVGDTFTTNDADGSGASGGAGVILGGTATITRSTFTGNTSGKHGGALYAAPKTLTVSASTFAGNVAGSTATGGAAGTGGAVDIGSGTFNATNVTFNGNEALTNAASSGEGGALFEIGGSASLSFVTVDGNVADYGAGLFEVSSTALGVALHGSIVSQNTSVAGAENDCTYVMSAATPTSSGGNVLGQAGCAASLAASDVVSTAPNLSGLAANGGATKTMALASGSPALTIASACPTTDQRGTSRPTSACDAGAYELTA